MSIYIWWGRVHCVLLVTSREPWTLLSKHSLLRPNTPFTTWYANATSIGDCVWCNYPDGRRQATISLEQQMFEDGLALCPSWSWLQRKTYLRRWIKNRGSKNDGHGRYGSPLNMVWRSGLEFSLESYDDHLIQCYSISFWSLYVVLPFSTVFSSFPVPASDCALLFLFLWTLFDTFNSVLPAFPTKKESLVELERCPVGYCCQINASPIPKLSLCVLDFCNL